jgi:sulfite reductase (NADPH) flavoprotein alpha-component
MTVNAADYPECFLSEEASFLPQQPPLLALPDAFRAWDALARQLPDLVARLKVRAAVEQLPILRAGVLPNESLSRAASLLGIIIHSVVREGQLLHLPVSIPDHLQRAWEGVCHRLHRPGTGLTYNDLILYNWRLRDSGGPRVVENMDLMTPVYGSEEERLFYLVQVESHTVATPLVGAVSHLREALGRHDDGRVIAVLGELSEMLDRMTFQTFMKLDPNPSSPNFVDQLVWGKAVAPFAFPVHDGELGLSGGGSPIFQVLDALLGRAQWQTSIGKQLIALQPWMSPPLLEFIRQAAELGLPAYVQNRPQLHGAFHRFREAYTGERGWLGVHRLKVYGFMEMAFKAGRTQTNGGFSGATAERAWERLDNELEESRHERGGRSRCPMARHVDVRPVAGSGICQVSLNTDVHFRPGDRLGVWPRNTPELVARTLAALQASGNEPLQLTASWKDALAFLGAVPSGTSTVPLRAFLEFARLRPLARSTGKQLLRLVHVPELHQVLEQRQEDQYEVWDALELMRRHNYDTRRLWQASPWHDESLARILLPENRRIYSISSAPSESLVLTVGKLSLTSRKLGDETTVERLGTGSQHLTRPGEPFPVEVVRPTRFSLPDMDKPVVMFAAGTGISPFRSFWLARRSASAPTWLMGVVRDPGLLAYAGELADEVANHGLEVHIICSRDDRELVSQHGRLVTQSAPRGYVDRAIAEHRQRLWELLRSRQEGGLEGHFYICGQTRFAHTVHEALKGVVEGRLSQEADGLSVLGFFRRLRAHGRLMEDIFTTFAPGDAPGVHPYRTYDASEVIFHNNETNGYWCVISGLVYDVTEFVWHHPGGARLIKLNAGLDATRSYETVGHHQDPEVHASLDLYKIGKIRRLDFGRRWGVTILPDPSGARPETATAHAHGLLYFTLHDLYRHWIRYVFSIVELENSLAQNRDLGHSPRLGSAPPGSRLHLAFQIDILRVFTEIALTDLTDPPLQRLWHLQAGLCSPGIPLPKLGQDLESGRSQRQAIVKRVLDECGELLALERPELADRLEGLLGWSATWLARLKLELAEGIRAFEAHEAHVVERAGQRLTAILAGIPVLLTEYVHGLERAGFRSGIR